MDCPHNSHIVWWLKPLNYISRLFLTKMEKWIPIGFSTGFRQWTSCCSRSFLSSTHQWFRQWPSKAEVLQAIPKDTGMSGVSEAYPLRISRICLGPIYIHFFTVDDLPIRSEFDLELQLNDQQGMGTQTAGDFHSRGFHRFWPRRPFFI